jgi:undecaprenyl-diphosphatase
VSWVGHLWEGRKWVTACDRDLAQRLALPEGAVWRRRGATLGAHVGDSLIWLLLALSVLLWGDGRLKEVGLQSLLGIAVSAGLAAWIKFRLRRGRPPGAPGEGSFFSSHDRYSFPSGHAVRMGCLTLLLAAGYPSLAPFLCGLTLITLFSRLYLGLHYLSDTVAGVVIGLGLGLGTILLCEQLPLEVFIR